jgi:hypothetical protein
MNPGTTRRGQPLLVFGLILGGWILTRFVLWEGLNLPRSLAEVPAAVLAGPIPPQPSQAAVPVASPATMLPQPAVLPLPALQPAPLPIPAPLMPAWEQPGTGGPVNRVTGGHQIAWIAGLAQLPIPLFQRGPPGLIERTASLTPASAALPVGPEKAANRWSADGWLMLRRGGVPLTASGLPAATYGASQAGAVLRYRLAPDSKARPTAYLRATTALQRPRGEEAALGLAVRPLAALPVALTAELRATRFASGTVVRPAAALVTELDRFNLPAGFSAEVYAQAGYVGGAGRTGFADGQARIEREVLNEGRVRLRAGAGAWGGAQRGASRVDLGPTATLDFPLGGGQGRIAADWRLRVAGTAAPQSGPALTLSAGF